MRTARLIPITALAALLVVVPVVTSGFVASARLAVRRPAPVEASLSIDQPPPYEAGDTLTFTAVYERRPGNAEEVLRINCFDGGVDSAWSYAGPVAAVTVPLASSCLAWVELVGHKGGFDTLVRVTPYLTFEVSPAMS